MQKIWRISTVVPMSRQTAWHYSFKSLSATGLKRLIDMDSTVLFPNTWTVGMVHVGIFYFASHEMDG
uniref:Wsv070 n=1 Tax=White spot syndrome virus TaxID=92652 RepID=A0A2U9GC45_WSSV|nr:wsv070 [Shrimp white spot syndrome virus]